MTPKKISLNNELTRDIIFKISENNKIKINKIYLREIRPFQILDFVGK